MPGPALSEDEIRALARQRMDEGRLPAFLARNLDAGYGTGDLCRVCGQPILHGQVEYEVRNPAGGKPITLHLMCHAIWQLECAHRIRQSKHQHSSKDRS